MEAWTFISVGSAQINTQHAPLLPPAAQTSHPSCTHFHIHIALSHLYKVNPRFIHGS